MPLFFLSLEPGSDTYLYQETLYRSESCRRRLRKTAPCGSPGMATQVVKHIADATGVPPSPAGPPGSCPLHLLHLSNLRFMIGMPNRCCILELRANQCFVCNFLSVPRCKSQIAPKKSNRKAMNRNWSNQKSNLKTHCLSCLS